MPEFNLKDYRISDTIAAAATAPSRSALGVVKVSGKKSLDILDKLFCSKRKKKIKKQKSFTLHYGWIVDRRKGDAKVIDEVLVSLMRSPRSYTTEDVVEISSHGGQVVVNQILEAVLREGARLAYPGEFTYRALVGGRIDLLQAESVLSLVEAKTPEAVFLSSRQLKGQSSERFSKIKKEIKKLFVESESLLNFPEEDIKLDRESFKENINRVIEQVDELQESQRQAKMFSQGLKCVICGRANSGKSTLFNRLLREERVIVSRTPGTTRDVVEEIINIKGIPVRIYDTAGILEPKDFVTKKALQKTTQMFKEADLVVLLFDGSRKLNKDDKFFLERTENKNTVLVINKADLPRRISFNGKGRKRRSFIEMSALKDINLEKVEKMIYKAARGQEVNQENLIFLGQYQKKELNNLAVNLLKVKSYLQKGYTIDFINLSLKECLDSVGKITGEVYCEEILESIFSNFCIGK